MQPALIFMHVPKTGGITLLGIIRRYCSPAQTLDIFGESVATVQDSVNRLRAMTEAERRDITCVQGHMPFGIHQFLPRPARYLTILREPTARMVSDYYFARNTPEHSLHAEVNGKRMSLRDFIEMREQQGLGNLTCRSLSGLANWDDLAASPRECTPAMLDAAKRNLEKHFAVVGLTERFDESLLLVADAFGWPDMSYARENVTRNKPRAAPIADDALQAMHRYHGLDMQLYEYARQRFEERVAAAGPAFGARLQAFRQANARFARGLRLRRAVASVLPDPVVAMIRRLRHAVT